MVDITEGALKFSFNGQNVFKYDDSGFYRQRFERLKFTKVVGIIMINTG